MSEQRFYITDTGLGLDTVSDEMYSFGDEEDFCRLFDKLNEQQEQLDLYKEAILTMLGLLADKGIILSGVKDG